MHGEPVEESASSAQARRRVAAFVSGFRRATAIVLFRSHVWFGLFTAVAVVVISLTGIYLNHRESLGLWERPDQKGQGNIEDALSIRELLILGLTGAHDSGLDVSSVSRDINRMKYRPDRGQAAVRINDARSTEVVLDANSGEVLQVSQRDDVTIERIHSGEVLGQRGVIVSDIAAGALILLAVGGVFLWLNRVVRNWGRREGRRGGGVRWMSVNRRIHLVGGVVVAVIVIVIAVTGILLNHKREFGYMVEPYIPFEYGKISPMSLDEIARAAVTGTPELSATSANDVRWIDFRPGLSYAKVRFRDGRDTEVLIDAYDGDVVSVASRQDAFLERLHSGEFIGGRWTLLSDAAAVILILLTLNGVYLWMWPVWSGRTRASLEGQSPAGEDSEPQGGGGPE